MIRNNIDLIDPIDKIISNTYSVINNQQNYFQYFPISIFLFSGSIATFNAAYILFI